MSEDMIGFLGGGKRDHIAWCRRARRRFCDGSQRMGLVVFIISRSIALINLECNGLVVARHQEPCVVSSAGRGAEELSGRRRGGFSRPPIVYLRYQGAQKVLSAERGGW